MELKNVLPFTGFEAKANYILIINAANKPPHLGLCIDQRYYGISTKGAYKDEPIEKHSKLASAKKLECIYVQLENRSDQMQALALKHLHFSITDFPLVNQEISCLYPVKDFCCALFELQKEGINFIFDLLEVLESHGLIRSYYHLNLQGKLLNNCFKLNTYTKQDVQNCIEVASR